MKKRSASNAALDLMAAEGARFTGRLSKPQALRDQLRSIRKQHPKFQEKAAAGLLEIIEKLDAFVEPIKGTSAIVEPSGLQNEDPVQPPNWLSKAKMLSLKPSAAIVSRGLKLLSSWLSR
jgi:hypothetical protein